MLGDILRKARKARKLTLKQLAEKVGVSAGYLSHLETGKLEPSISVLRKLTETLELPANIVLDSQERKRKVSIVRKEERARVQFSNLCGEAWMLTPFLWKGGIRSYLKAIELSVPGESVLASERLSVEVDEFIYILSGSIEYCVGETVEILEEGSSIYIPKLVGHDLRNLSKEPARLIWITRGGEGR